MNCLERVYDIASLVQTEPVPGSTYHLIWVAAVLIFCAFVCVVVRYLGDMTFRRITLILWIVMLLFEVYKQTVGNLDVANGEVVYRYSWENFPFQLCSTPLYVLPFLALLKDGSVRDFFASYTMTYALIGGIAVYMFPNSVFGEYVIGNVQTMVHHGIQIATGVMTAVRYRKRLDWRFFLKGLAVFILMFCIAMSLNTFGRDYLISVGAITDGDTFNMFLISPYMEFHYPVFGDVLQMLSPWTMVGLYFVGLPVGAALVMAMFKKFFDEKTKSKK